MTDGVKKWGDNLLSSDIMRGYNDIFILAILTEGDSYGYEISKKISETSDNLYSIKVTTLYSAFTRLKKKGLIFDSPGDTTHGKPRTYYAITGAGTKFLTEKKDEWQLTKIVVEKIIGG